MEIVASSQRLNVVLHLPHEGAAKGREQRISIAHLAPRQFAWIFVKYVSTVALNIVSLLCTGTALYDLVDVGDGMTYDNHVDLNSAS